MRLGEIARRISLWFGSVVIALLAILAIVLVQWYSEKSNDLRKRFDLAMKYFDEGVHHTVEKNLAKFAKRTGSDIFTLLGTATEDDIDSHDGSIATGATWISPGPAPSLLRFGRADSQAVLSYTYSGLFNNSENQLERASITLEAKLDSDFNSSAGATGFDAIFIADRQGAVLGKYGRPGITALVPYLENINVFHDSRGHTVRIGEEEYVVFPHDIYFRDSIPETLKVAGQNAGELSLRALGVIRKSKLADPQLPQAPFFALCFFLLIGMLSFPFLQLFAPRPAEPFSRVDAALLLTCGTGLVALCVTGLLFMASFRALGEKEEASLRRIAGKIIGEMTKAKHAVPEASDPTLADLALQESSKGYVLSKARGYYYAVEKKGGQGGAGEDENRDEAALRHLIEAADSHRSKVIPLAGDSYRFFVKPMKGDSRVVITACDQVPLRSVSVQVALYCLLLFVLYVLAITAYLVIFLAPPTKSKGLFFWPTQELGGAYAVLAAGYVVVLILACAISLYLAPQWVIFIGFLIPLLVLITTVTGLVRWMGSRGGAATVMDRKTDGWLVAMAMVLAILLALLLESAGRATWVPRALAVALPLALGATFKLADRWSRADRWSPGLGRKWGAPLYAGAVVALIVVLGGLPAFCCYEAVFSQEMRLLADWTHQSDAKQPPTDKDHPPRTSLSVPLKEWNAGVMGGLGAQAFDRSYEVLRLSPNDNRYAKATNDILLTDPWDDAKRRPVVARDLGLTAISPWGWLAFAALAAVVGWLLVASVRRLFGRGFPRQGPRPESLRDRQILWVGPPGKWIGELATISRVQKVDLAQVGKFLKTTAQGPGPVGKNTTLLIPDFGARWLDDNISQVRYEVIKKLVGEWQGGIWLVSEVAPEELAPPTGAQAASAGAPHELAAALQDELTIVHGRDDRAYIKKLARIEPETIWKSLSKEEKLTLVRIATSGCFAQGEHARPLVAYGVLSADPAPQIATPELRRLVLAKRGEVQEESSGATAPASFLSGLRPVLALCLFGVLAFLSLTQEDWFRILSGVIAAIALALSGVSQIGAWLRSPGSGDVH